MDLKIEIRKLYALHEATIRFDHAIKQVGQAAWTDFNPSRFIYAFFTFNSIYSFDWEASFNEKKAIKWTPDSAGRVPKEDEQFKAYLRYADSALKQITPQIFSQELTRLLKLYAIARPIEELQPVELVNATKKLKNLAQQLPGEHLTAPDGATERMPRLWKLLDSPNWLPRFVTELLTQAYALCIVVTDCFFEFTARGEQESGFQVCLPNSAKTSSASTAPSSPER